MAQYYVRATNGTDAAGNGTSHATAYKTIQYALNDIATTHGAGSTGNQVNICDEAAQALTASLSLATYGTPTEAAPLIIRGYTTAANDGGIGEINNGGSNIAVFSSSTLPINFVNMKIGNCGTAAIVTAGPGSRLIGCEIWSSAGTTPAVFLYGSTVAVNYICGCYIHDITASVPVRVGSGNTIAGVIYGNLISVVANAGANGALYLNGYHAVVVNNVVHLLTGSGAGAYGIYAERTYNVILNNTVRRVAGGTAAGIAVLNGPSVVANNIVENWSGTGGNGIYDNSATTRSVAAANAGYNNTTNLNVAGKEQIVMSAMTALAASPFVNAASGNFNINGSITGVTETAWPTSWPGYTPGTTPLTDVGAVQAGAGAAPDYPAEADVRLGVDYDSATKTGTLDLPAVGDVQSGVTFDGATKTGTFAAPAVSNVRSGVGFGAGGMEYTGTLALPAVEDVEAGVQYGAGGTEYTGTLVVSGADPDWTDDEKAQIRQALGITGAKAATSGGNLDSLVAVAPDNKPTVAATGEASANVTMQAGVLIPGPLALESTAQAILEDTETTLPGLFAASGATVTVISAVDGGRITVYVADTWSFTVTDATLDLSGYESVALVVKRNARQADAEALLYLRSDTGLQRIGGAAPAAAGNGTLSKTSTSFTALVALAETGGLAAGQYTWWLKGFDTTPAPDTGFTLATGEFVLERAGLGAVS